ncbi:hypothetical protein SK128_027716 [Halocaridina rubra]|uniref:Uncharacterized protein n=1 Tax=Halocaridina rubra TaxID=373956 RepID=A0AAN8WY35_HALRR
MSSRQEMIDDWETKTGLEKILIMVCFGLCISLLGFIVGVAALKSTEHDNLRQISFLKDKLEDCRSLIPSSTTVTSALLPFTYTPRPNSGYID